VSEREREREGEEEGEIENVVWKQGGRSDEREREVRELNNRITLSRSLQHRPSCCMHGQARYVLRIVSKTALALVVRRAKMCFSPSISLSFLCAHARAYVHMLHENVTGSLETPSLLPGCALIRA
jgi:hypothetical protein